MPPPMPNPAKRFTANPARPVGRYRPGKAVPEEESEDEDDESEEEATTQQPQKRAPARSQPTTRREESVNEEEDEEGFVTDEEEDGETGDQNTVSKPAVPAPAGGEPRTRTTTSEPIPADPDEDEDEEASSDESGSSEEEDSSESEPEPQRKFQRPTFIKKPDRKPPSSTDHRSTPAPDLTTSTPGPDSNHRRAMAELMIKDELEKAAQARLAGKKYWDDDEDLAPEDLVDDTDGLDPALERKEWEVRELKRLKRDRERIEEREREIEEIERRRGLSKEEREREDADHLERQAREREEGRGEPGGAFMKKYYHKGAFFLDDEHAARLANRDFHNAKFADEVDKDLLPEYMRVRDMSKLGKKGGTRYRDLRAEDTGRFGDRLRRWRPGDERGEGGVDDGAGRTGGRDERFMSERERERALGPTASGANAGALGVRRRSNRSRSRSRSPAGRRKRSVSPYVEDKRRRTET